MKKIGVFLITLCLGSLTACSSAQNIRTQSLDEFTGVTPGSGLLLMDTIVETVDDGVVSSFGCDLTVKNVTSGRAFRFSIPAHVSANLVELRAGGYVMENLWCAGRLSGLDRSTQERVFQVKADSVNYTGLHSFWNADKSPQIDQAKLNREASELVWKTFKQINGRKKMKWWNAYTGEDVTAHFAAAEKRSKKK